MEMDASRSPCNVVPKFGGRSLSKTNSGTRRRHLVPLRLPPASDSFGQGDDNVDPEETTLENIKVDAGKSPPVDRSLFFGSSQAYLNSHLRPINDRSIESAIWSAINIPEMKKMLLSMEKIDPEEVPNVINIPTTNSSERFKNVAYIWACYRGLPRLLSRLEKLGVDVNYVEPSTGINAIQAASLSGSVSCLEHLLKNKIDVNLANHLNDYTPLHFAAIGNSAGTAELLLRHGAKLHVEHQDVDPVLHCALWTRSVEVVQLLLTSGADVTRRNQLGDSPLHVACYVRSTFCVGLLLRTSGIDVDAVDRIGRTPLHLAVMDTTSSIELVELLLRHGAAVNVRDQEGFTPLHIAALNELPSCVDALIWAGADIGVLTNAGLSALSAIVRKVPESLRVFRRRLDASISLKRPVAHNRELEMRLHFEPLFPNNSECETSFINMLVQEHQKDLLSHPLVMAFLHLKWRKIRRFYLARIILYAMTVVCMTTYVLTALAYRCYNDDDDTANSSITKFCRSQSIARFLFRKPIIEFEWYLLVILTCLTVPRKIFGSLVYKSARQYFLNIDNVLDIVVIVSVFVISFVYTGQTYDWQNYVGAFAVLCAWTNLMLMVGQLPAFGTYIAMFTHIQFEFAKLLLAYSGLLIGFSVSFCVIFASEPSFGNPLTALIKVLAMMVGELDFEGLVNQVDNDTNDRTNESLLLYHPLSVCSQIIFTLFIIFVTVILMNLLVGIAVHDIRGLRSQAGLTKLVRQTKLILLSEKIQHNLVPVVFRKWMVDPKNRKINIGDRKRALVVKPLNPLEKRLPRDVLEAAHRIAQRNASAVKFEDDVGLGERAFWWRPSDEDDDVGLRSIVEHLSTRFEGYENEFKLIRERLVDTNKMLESVIARLSSEEAAREKIG